MLKNRNPKLRAAIIGLGQVGMLFDLDKLRKGIWTHFSVYEKLYNIYELVAVCDPDPKKIALALKRKTVRAYSSMEMLLKNEEIDVVSICTPPQFHAEQIRKCVGHVKAVVCEKPLGVNLSDCVDVVKLSNLKGTVLAVNYYKRFEAHVQFVKETVLSRKMIGELVLIRAAYTGPLEAVGVHMIDLLSFFLGKLTLHSSRCIDSTLMGYSALLTTSSGASVNLDWVGQRENLVFEVEFIGTEGRCVLTDNCSQVAVSRFRSSKRYSGYRELVPTKIKAIKENERFIPLFHEVVSSINLSGKLTSSGETALETQRLFNSILEKAYV